MLTRSEPLRVVFMGTPAFAVPPLKTLLARDHDVVGVFTQPDRRSGRGRSLTGPPVKMFALECGIRVFQPASLRNDVEACGELSDLAPDVIVVAAYGIFLPDVVLETPRLGCLNIHPSLLPRHRGPSPVVTAVLDGDAVTGVTVMLLDAGMDSGPILAQVETPVGEDEYAKPLTERLFDLGSDLLVSTLDRWSAGAITPVPQDHDSATFTRRLTREDGLVAWSRPAEALERQVRALNPWPGAFSSWDGRTVKIGRARSVAAEARAPGTVFEVEGGGVAVAAGEGALELLSVQLEGGRWADASDFSRGRDFVGSVLGGSALGG